jgi:hypothetical protein
MARATRRGAGFAGASLAVRGLGCFRIDLYRRAKTLHTAVVRGDVYDSRARPCLRGWAVSFGVVPG